MKGQRAKQSPNTEKAKSAFLSAFSTDILFQSALLFQEGTGSKEKLLRIPCPGLSLCAEQPLVTTCLL